MSDWTGGYVTDVDYTSHFFSHLSPTLIDLALLLKGVRPPRLEPAFTYCELGCGHGLTINVLAASNPEARFWATDFNPTHIATARGLAQSAGLDNIKFADSGFDEFIRTDLPEFDYIALHGVYSWVSEQNRGHIVEFVRRKLRPGGAFSISYNCLPGWAPLMPLRQLLVDYPAPEQEPLLARVEKALDFAQRLAALKRGYFAANPVADACLKSLRGRPGNYIAHEFFGREVRPQYFAEVTRELADAKLAFAAPSDVTDEHEFAAAGKPVADLLGEVADPIFRETLRDFVRNRNFRRDIFVKGVVPLTAQQKVELIGNTAFALFVPWERVPEKFALSGGEVVLKRETLDPMLRALADGPKTPAELQSVKAPDTLGFGKAVQLLMILVAGGFVAPSRRAPDRATRSYAAKLNQTLLHEAQNGDRFHALASPFTASGVPVAWIDQLFLLARASRDDPVQFALTTIARHGWQLRRDGKPVEDAARHRMLVEMAAAFNEQRVPVYAKLGICD